jgi:hypothetical protein
MLNLVLSPLNSLLSSLKQARLSCAQGALFGLLSLASFNAQAQQVTFLSRQLDRLDVG